MSSCVSHDLPTLVRMRDREREIEERGRENNGGAFDCFVFCPRQGLSLISFVICSHSLPLAHGFFDSSHIKHILITTNTQEVEPQQAADAVRSASLVFFFGPRSIIVRRRRRRQQTRPSFFFSFPHPLFFSPPHSQPGALHTVLLCRLLGAVRPLDVVARSFAREEKDESESDLFVYATCGDRAVAAAVDERAEAFGAWALRQEQQEQQKGSSSSATVVLSLRERLSASSPPSPSFDSSSSTGCCSPPWETWHLPIRVVAASPSPTRLEGEGEEEQEQEQQREEEQERGQTFSPPLLLRGAEGLRSLLLSISSRAAARTGHIPPVLTASVITFPFEISFEGGAAGAEATAAAGGFPSSTKRSRNQRQQQQQQQQQQRNSSNNNPRSSPSPSSPSPAPSPSAGSVLRGGLGAVKRLLQAAPPPPVLG